MRMHTNIFTITASLSDADLLARVILLARQERHVAAELIAHLAELDTREVLVAEGFSLFTYCTGRLGFSEDAAYTRVEVARAARRFPLILEGLSDGSLNLTTIRLLGRHLTAENHRSVLDQARRRSKREIEVLVAQLAPRPDVPSSIRKVAAAPRSEETPRPANEMTLPAVTIVPVSPPPVPTRPPVIAPLAPERYRMQFTVGKQTHDTLRRLQELLRREVPSGDAAVIVDRALALLLKDVERKKLAAAAKPRPGTVRSGTGTHVTRHVPAAVRRAVWKRDGGQCALVSGSGHRCRERAFLEIHHIHPYALGGPPTLENLALRCRRHNDYEARLVFGQNAVQVRETSVPYGRRSGTTHGPNRAGRGSIGEVIMAGAPARHGHQT